MKWLIVFKKENHNKAMSLLETLGCSILKPIADLDKEDKVVSVEGPDNLVQLTDQLTKLIESSKDVIKIWCDSKVSITEDKPFQRGFGANPPRKHSYPDQSQTEMTSKPTTDFNYGCPTLDILVSPAKKGI